MCFMLQGKYIEHFFEHSYEQTVRLKIGRQLQLLTKLFSASTKPQQLPHARGDKKLGRKRSYTDQLHDYIPREWRKKYRTRDSYRDK